MKRREGLAFTTLKWVKKIRTQQRDCPFKTCGKLSQKFILKHFLPPASHTRG